MVRSATGRSIPDFMHENLFYPLGLEHKAYYQTDGTFAAFVFERIKYLNTRLRRSGQVILQNGNWQGRQIVPANWTAASTATSAPTD